MRCINRTTAKTNWYFYDSNDALANPKHILHVTRTSQPNKARCEPGAFQDVSPSTDSVYIEIQSGKSIYVGANPIKLNLNVYSYPTTFNKNRAIVFNGIEPVEIDDQADSLLSLGGWQLSAKGTAATGDKTLGTLNDAVAFSTAIVDSLIGGYASKSFGLGAAKLGVGIAGVFLGMLREDKPPKVVSIAEFKSAMNEVLDERSADEYSATIMGAAEWFGGWAQRVQAMNSGTASGDSVELSGDDLAEFRRELDNYTDGHSGSTFQDALTQLDHNPNIRVLALPEYVIGLSLDIHLERIKLLLKSAEGKSVTVHDLTDLATRITRYKDWLIKSEQDLDHKVTKLHQKYPFAGLARTSTNGRMTPILESFARFDPPTDQADYPAEHYLFLCGCLRRYLNGDQKLLSNTIATLNALLADINDAPTET